MMRCWQPVTTLMVAMCLLLAGCVKESGWEQAMQALKDDPMTSASWEGLELTSHEETSNEGHKPKPPSITRCYKMTIPPEKAFSKVIETAQKHGWTEETGVRTKESALAGKTINNALASLILSTRSGVCDPSFDPQFRITINYR